MRIALIAVLAYALAVAFGPASAKYLEQTVGGCNIENGSGGKVREHLLAVKEANDACEVVRLAKTCLSACTIFLDRLDSEFVCLTPHARLGLHQARREGGWGFTINEQLADKALRWMPPSAFDPLYSSPRAVAWIRQQGGLQKEYLFVRPAKAIEIWGWHWCEGDVR